MYEGWQCPMCLDEQERAAAAAAPGAAPAPPSSSAPGQPAAGRGDVSHAASRAESQAKAARAEAVLLAGSAREALDMCEAAIEMDRRNLNAYLVGARASRILRDAVNEQELLEGAIKLLRTEEYGKTSRWYVEVLKQVRDSRMVSQLADAFANARKWPPDEALAMVKGLVSRGATWEAVSVLDKLPVTSRSLLTCAYSLQIAGSSGPGVDPDLLRYLQSVPATDRARLLAELYEVQSSEVLAGMTVVRVRDALRRRYQEWSNEIKQVLSEEARQAAAERIAPQLHGPAVSSAVRFFLGALAFAALVVALAGGGGVGILAGTVLALGCGVAGYAYGRDVELKRLLPTVLPGVREELTTREVERWVQVLSEEPIGSSTHEAAAEEPAAMDSCPYCTAPVPFGASDCPQCSKPLSAPPETDAAPGGAGAPAEAATPSHESAQAPEAAGASDDQKRAGQA
jgi:hypothetical protein